ncbi:MAG: hypothetical protein IJP09_00130 [Clostridia bacterium]|nr:hypothetical protein [Clostridia bacterium]
MDKNLTNSDIPLGLGMALAQNTEALKVFGRMPVAQQQEFIENAHLIRSSNDMRAYVNTLIDGGERK